MQKLQAEPTVDDNANDRAQSPVDILTELGTEGADLWHTADQIVYSTRDGRT